jgi:hypothetical protein
MVRTSSTLAMASRLLARSTLVPLKRSFPSFSLR